jgi:hypothetical protein
MDCLLFYREVFQEPLHKTPVPAFMGDKYDIPFIVVHTLEPDFKMGFRDGGRKTVCPFYDGYGIIIKCIIKPGILQVIGIRDPVEVHMKETNRAIHLVD